VIASFALKALELVSAQPELCIAVNKNAEHFRKSMTAKGFKIMGNANHPICPVLIGDAVIAGKMAEELRVSGIFVTAFSYPVVPHDLSRIRVQLSASHTKEQIDSAVTAFERIGTQYNVI
jgi:7-keto-8-aminopelargonate synthetase-like enzyme